MKETVRIPWLLVAALAVTSSAVSGQPPGQRPNMPPRQRPILPRGGPILPRGGPILPRGGGMTFDRLLERFDKNDDGKVSRDEFQGPAQYFPQMDGDGDGVVTREEFRSRMDRRAVGGPDRTPGNRARPAEADARREGAGASPEGADASPEGERGAEDRDEQREDTTPRVDKATLLKMLDADKDGRVSKKELETFLKQNDSDDDGMLNEDELGVAIASVNERVRVEVDGPSVIAGQQAGIGIGYCTPDFELQPIEPYADLQTKLGRNTPPSIEETVMLSQLVGDQPVLLLFGSYT